MENQINKFSQHYGIPNEARSYILNWDNICPSPYNRIGGGSWYNHDKITWDNKPDGTLRLSDHWNFFSLSGGGIHCPTLDSELKGWAICVMENGLWKTVIQFDKKNKYTKHFENLHSNRILNMQAEKNQKIERIEREAKINKSMANGSYWAILKRNISTRVGRRFTWNKEVCLVQVSSITPFGGMRGHDGTLYKVWGNSTFYFRKPSPKALTKARKEYLN